jgi:exodeoxyribonuclease VII small subunit
MTASDTRAKKEKDAPTFETSLDRLERIVEQMEDGKLSLEDMIRRFEEGQGLIRFCSGKLDEVERRIEILMKKDGVMTAEPFEPADAEEPSRKPRPDKEAGDLF